MANVLNNYHQDVITVSDYLHSLRQYTQQHYLPDGKINLVENYDPNLSGPIVFYYWSNHYNHSSYNNLIISGLCGIRPSEGDELTIHPLVDNSIEYFYLDDVRYHGHKLSVIYDRDGTQYSLGKGLHVFVDGKKKELTESDNSYKVLIGPVISDPMSNEPTNVALNLDRKGYPTPSASVNVHVDSIYQVVDGRIWYFPEITNRWTTLGSASTTDWLSLDLGKPTEISSMKIFLFTSGEEYSVPDKVTIEYESGGQWSPVKITGMPSVFTGNTVNNINFEKITASKVRVTFTHNSKHVAVSEVEVY